MKVTARCGVTGATVTYPVLAFGPFVKMNIVACDEDFIPVGDAKDVKNMVLAHVPNALGRLVDRLPGRPVTAWIKRTYGG